VAYLYRPTLVLRVNAWGRTILFNDAHLLHFRRRWGLLAFLAATLFLYSGFLNLTKSIPIEPVRDPIEAGYLAFYEKRFDAAGEIAVAIFERASSGSPRRIPFPTGERRLAATQKNTLNTPSFSSGPALLRRAQAHLQPTLSAGVGGRAFFGRGI
jgi:hypothetical protein